MALQSQNEHPFPNRVPAPPFPDDATWLNTSGPLRLADLKGKFVLLDFWTYCCINCMHILPELKKLEHAYAEQLVVIGVHSAKFETEKDSKNISEAILRYDIEHPVVNDQNMRIWRSYRVNSWPSIRLIDPEGNVIAQLSGEFKFEQIDRALKNILPYYRRRKLIDETPVRFDLLASAAEDTPLRFPGKVVADPQQQRLFIADSNHHRIVVTNFDGKLQQTIGTGALGKRDGDFATAEFNHPQGMALAGDVLYVADTENHLIRRVDLARRQVTTIAGTGQQARWPWPGVRSGSTLEKVPSRPRGKARQTELTSPWDLWLVDDQLFIAMAGSHQIWVMDLDSKLVGPYAGNGREDIVDGELLPARPYGNAANGTASSFAQPSGLAFDGQHLLVADSEGSSIRAVPTDATGQVTTIVGTSRLPQARLFTFGDRDGPRQQALLQHCIGVAFGNGNIFVADTYNNKIKSIDAATGETRTLAGTGQPGTGDDPAEFDEPAGLSFAQDRLYVADTNNHRIRVIDVGNGTVRTLRIQGLAPPLTDTRRNPDMDPLAGLKATTLGPARVGPTDGRIPVAIELELPPGWKLNPAAPMQYFVRLQPAARGGDFRDQNAKWQSPTVPAPRLDVYAAAQPPGKYRLQVGLRYYYCRHGAEGLCKVGGRVWNVPLTILAQPSRDPVTIRHRITP